MGQDDGKFVNVGNCAARPKGARIMRLALAVLLLTAGLTVSMAINERSRFFGEPGGVVDELLYRLFFYGARVVAAALCVGILFSLRAVWVGLLPLWLAKPPIFGNGKTRFAPLTEAVYLLPVTLFGVVGKGAAYVLSDVQRHWLIFLYVWACCVVAGRLGMKLPAQRRSVPLVAVAWGWATIWAIISVTVLTIFTHPLVYVTVLNVVSAVLHVPSFY